MSFLNDESFPEDEILDELNASLCVDAVGASFKESSNNSQCPSSELSGKTCASDPAGGNESHNDNPIDTDCESKFGVGNQPTIINHQSTKAVSYQDIHSEYTKRRFKHVVSKVGLYIAQMKAEEDEKRRGPTNKFQRHQSMPETLTPQALSREMGGSSRYSVDQLQQLHDSDGDDASFRTDVLLNKIEQLQLENKQMNDYIENLQTQNLEKVSENASLKRNIDEARYMITNLEDKLKRVSAPPRNESFGEMPPRFLLPSRTNTNILKSMLHNSCGTQTELITPKMTRPPPPTMTLNSSNAKTDILYASSEQSGPATSHTNIATIQPLSLNFSNDSSEAESQIANAERRTGDNNFHANTRSNRPVTNNSGSSQPSSNDSAIDLEAAELPSPTAARSAAVARVSRQVSINPQPLPRNSLFYYDNRAKRYVSLEAINLVSLNTRRQASATSIVEEGNTSSTVEKKKSTFGSRMLRIFGPCARCDDPHQTLNGSNESRTHLLRIDKFIGSSRH